MSSNHFSDPSKTAFQASETIEICDSEERKAALDEDAQLVDCLNDGLVVISRAHPTLDEETESPIKRQKKNDMDTPKVNPFARFAHPSGSTDSKPEIATRPISIQENKIARKNKKDKTFKENPPRMDSLSPAEVENVKNKWYGFVQPDDSIEDQRFQLLVAARLHARCQDKAVHHAMVELRKSLLPMPFSAETIAQADPSKLQESISNLQFYSVKAKQIVQAANEIVSRYDGKVPESESTLLKLTGIGPVFADLLAAINTRAEHQSRRENN